MKSNGLDHKKIYNLTSFLSGMVQDTSIIKGKIISFLKRNGPSLPVNIAREIETSPLFTSAFLSELVAEKRIKISNMKIGNSPLYFIQGQEFMLERFYPHLKSREKDAFEFLKEKKFLKDSEQEPAIRVALREIKDFAMAFKKDGEIIWKYFSVPEREFSLKEVKPKLMPKKEIKKEKSLGIFEKPKKPKAPRKTSREKENKLFNKVKEFLAEKSIQLLDIKSFSKNELSLRVKENEEEKLLVAYNKRRINDKDIIKASKKASELNLPHIIVSFGEPLKKVDELIKASKNLSSIEKLK
jgi:hypothetical protein